MTKGRQRETRGEGGIVRRLELAQERGVGCLLSAVQLLMLLSPPHMAAGPGVSCK